jgi:hypothetical protein
MKSSKSSDSPCRIPALLLFFPGLLTALLASHPLTGHVLMGSGVLLLTVGLPLGQVPKKEETP